MKQFELAIAIICGDSEPEVFTKTVTAASKQEAVVLTAEQAQRFANVLEGKPFDFRIEVAEPEEIAGEPIAA